jgi:hypothetical protein
LFKEGKIGRNRKRRRRQRVVSERRDRRLKMVAQGAVGELSADFVCMIGI